MASPLKLREAHLAEPNPDSVRIARKRITPMFKGQHLRWHPVALSDQRGQLHSNAARSLTRVPAETTEGDGDRFADENVITVECSTLDILSAQFTNGRVLLLKIDVEGREDQVLAGAQARLQAQRVDLFYIEAGIDPHRTQQVHYRLIESRTPPFGDRLFRIYEQHFEWMQDSPLPWRANLALIEHPLRRSEPLPPDPGTQRGQAGGGEGPGGGRGRPRRCRAGPAAGPGAANGPGLD